MKEEVQHKVLAFAMAMHNVHLAPEGEEGDLYSGYEYSEPMMDVSEGLYLCVVVLTALA